MQFHTSRRHRSPEEDAAEDARKRQMEKERDADIEADTIPLLIDIQVLAMAMEKLNYTAAINELFEAFLVDMDMPYTFPYKRWTDYLKDGKNKAEVESLCRVSSKFDDQKKLMAYCIKQNLVDDKKVQSRLLMESEYTREKLKFILRHISRLRNMKPKSLQIARVMGMVTNDKVSAPATRGIIGKYFPRSDSKEFVRLLRSAQDDGAGLSPIEIIKICYWVQGSCTMYKQLLHDLRQEEKTALDEEMDYMRGVINTPLPDLSVSNETVGVPTKRRSWFGNK